MDIRREGSAYRGKICRRRVEAEIREEKAGFLMVRWGSRSFEVTYSRDGERWILDLGRAQVSVEILDPLGPAETPVSRRTDRLGRQEIRAAMPGRVVGVKVRSGEEVAVGQALLVVEAMKMENEVASPKAGTVTAIVVAPGQAVEPGALLAVVE